nr:TspO/MBR family protein [Oceanusvirus sp.]
MPPKSKLSKPAFKLPFELSPKLLVALVPSVAGYAASALCPMDAESRAANPDYTPPGWVFGVVWPILYILLGVAWYLNVTDLRVSPVYALLVAGLTAWVPLTSCYRENTAGIWLIAFCSLLVGYCMLLSGSASRMMLLPLLSWLSFAILLAVGAQDRRAGCGAMAPVFSVVLTSEPGSP